MHKCGNFLSQNAIRHVLTAGIEICLQKAVLPRECLKRIYVKGNRRDEQSESLVGSSLRHHRSTLPVLSDNRPTKGRLGRPLRLIWVGSVDPNN